MFFAYKPDNNLQISLKDLAQYMSVDEGLPYDVVYNILFEKDTEKTNKVNLEQYLNALNDLEELKINALPGSSGGNDTSNQNKSDSADRKSLSDFNENM